MQRSGSRHGAAIIVIVALVILSTSMGFLSSDLVLVLGPQHPELALDICHPVQIATTSTHVLLVYPQVRSMESISEGWRELPPTVESRLLKGSVKPDVPPPRQLV